MKNIPNILHMIWIGNKKPSDYFYTNLAQWRRLMPDWEFKIWLNKDLTPDKVDSSYLKLIHNCRNGAQKADLLKYYVVNKFGGYYVDADITPKKSLNELNIEDAEVVLCHDLPITWEYIAVGFFASTSNNPVLEFAINSMYTIDISSTEQQHTTGPGAMGRAYFAMKKKTKCTILPYWYFYRNMKGDQALDGSRVTENKENTFGWHAYEATWIKEPVEYDS